MVVVVVDEGEVCEDEVDSSSVSMYVSTFSSHPVQFLIFSFVIGPMSPSGLRPA